MEIDKTQLTADVASAVWTSLDPMGLQAPFDEQDPMIQFNVKAQILPIITHTVPVIERHFKERVLAVIAGGRLLDLDAETILQDVSRELDD